MSSSTEQIVAAIQFAPELLNVDKNLATALQLTFEAAGKDAKIIVLPELCISGLVIRKERDAFECAQDRNGYQTQAFAFIASQFKCYIVFGYIELLDGKLYNSAAIVGPSGLVGNAQKHNLYGPDNMWAQPSEALSPIVSTPNGRLGVLICRDVMNRYRDSYAHSKQEQKFYQKGSVDTIALLTNWGSDFAYPDASWVELVEDTGANVIISNRVGDESDMKFKGGSCVITKNRKIWTNGSSFTGPAVVGGIISNE